ncbi:hypothetical protein Salmuc_05246 [Salipiger mucosus DSM 16094]|uniref:Uncharacterized protein n=1 Tax=Salipiger mucosus DSM 16094 TaxID=1123237 RepID=S9QS91_9RHOB|nr:hypothetical protein Salmuc_05246 [Salipiger mucosus DSM 16094]
MHVGVSASARFRRDSVPPCCFPLLAVKSGLRHRYATPGPAQAQLCRRRPATKEKAGPAGPASECTGARMPQ